MNNITFIILSIAIFILIMLIDSILKEKNKIKLHKHFIYLNILFGIHILGLMLQIIFRNTNVPPIYFEYITYIGAMFEAVEIAVIAMFMNNQNILSGFSFFIFYS